MRDLLHQNYGAMTGTPTLVTGPLSALNDQALQFDGSTNSMTVPDSPSDSLAVADGGAGGMALSVWVRFVSLPGVAKAIIGKSGSFEFGITSTNKFYWFLQNGANSVTINSVATVAAGQWYHVVCVYNGDYSGTPILGNQTSGSTTASMPADYHMGVAQPSNLNLQAGKFTALEKGIPTSVVIDLRRAPDATLYQNVKALVFGPNTSTQPGEQLGVSGGPRIDPTTLVPGFLAFPMSAAAFYPGDVWLAWTCGGSNGNSGQLEIGMETTGGTRVWKPASYDSPPDQFGTPTANNANKFAIYMNYTPTGRTGAEGRALIYVNGQLDNFSAYTHGIADTANDILMASGTTVQIGGRPAIWARKLSPVEISYLYSAR